MPTKCWIGIDPGKGGGVAVVRQTVDGFDIPGPAHLHTHSCKDSVPLWDWLRVVTGQDGTNVRIVACYIEQVGGYQPGGKGDGKDDKRSDTGSSMFTFGLYTGIAVGFVVALTDREPTKVVPRVWQGGVGMKREKGESDTHWKSRLKAKAKRVFPDDVKKITNQTADAVLIAAYARACHG